MGVARDSVTCYIFFKFLAVTLQSCVQPNSNIIGRHKKIKFRINRTYVHRSQRYLRQYLLRKYTSQEIHKIELPMPVGMVLTSATHVPTVALSLAISAHSEKIISSKMSISIDYNSPFWSTNILPQQLQGKISQECWEETRSSVNNSNFEGHAVACCFEIAVCVTTGNTI